MFVNVGAWKNFDELEDSLTMNELNVLLGQIRKEKKQDYVFFASMQGIDLESYWGDPVEEKRQEIERRAAEKLKGFKEVERQELAEFGITFKTD